MAIGLSVLFFGGLAIIFYALWQMIAGDRTPPSTRPAEQLAIPAGAVQFSSIDEFAASAKSKPGSPFVLVIREADLAAKVKAELSKRSDLPFKDVTIKVEDNAIVLAGGMTVAAGISAPATVRIRPTAAAGRLTYDIPSIDLGPLPVPGVAKDMIADNIDRQLTAARIGDLMFVDGVQTRAGAITLVGRLR
ncbi:MAG: hypothetical protein EPO26_12360 [Chloroflexota bacterium]|nr:MAG: hypothetical protein EPO26_12360 [Chloroflexota bacterium]